MDRHPDTAAAFVDALLKAFLRSACEESLCAAIASGLTQNSSKTSTTGGNHVGFTNDQIEKNFTYHPPKNDQQERYRALRDKGKELAHMIATFVPDSRERAVAMTNLEQCIMWANAGIARNE